MTSFIIDLHNKCAYIYYKTEVAHYDRNSGSHISGMVAQAYRTGGSLEHRLFTHLAIALAYHACEEGYKVSYTSMQSLMQVLRTCEVDRRSRTKMNRILKSNLLVVDEVGYLPITSVEGNLFFQLISQLQEQTSIIITTNKGFEEWAEFLDDAALATAILDRLSYRCDRIQMSGKSYRLENRKSFLSKNDMKKAEVSN